MITGIMIDSREPEWIRLSQFGVPTMVTLLEYGDLWASTDDGAMIVVERKTPSDLLDSLKDDRLFPQLARMIERRMDDQITGRLQQWPYLMITGGIQPGANGMAVADGRITGWHYSQVQGALLTVQELGVFVTYCAGDVDYKDAVLRLGKRERDSVYKILPAKVPNVIGESGQILASLPGIGIEKVIPILEESGGRLAWALEDLSHPAENHFKGVGPKTKAGIRQALGLLDGTYLKVVNVEEHNGNGNSEK